MWKGKPIGAPVGTFNLNAYGNFIGLTVSMPGDGWMSGGWIGVIITAGIAGLLLGLAHRWFWLKAQRDNILSLVYILGLAMIVQQFRDGGVVSIAKFLLWNWLPLVVWLGCNWLLGPVSGASRILSAALGNPVASAVSSKPDIIAIGQCCQPQSGSQPMTSIGILWMQYGPYHLARALALQELAQPARVHALELANLTREYAWTRAAQPVEVITLCPGMISEQLSFRTVFRRARQQLKELGIEVCLLPSYSPKQSLAALLAAKSLGVKTVMMNESHAGTARAGRVGMWIKRRLVGMFDAALVGGVPHKRYFASLGMSEGKIFTGYDAVDNNFFARRAEEVRSQKSEVRSQYQLPEHYFLSLGRFVAKKNLTVLIRAYRRFLDSSPNCQTHLVMVGSGEEELKLRALCHDLRLPIYDHSGLQIQNPEVCAPGVHFYGFRQIDENPVFYALADAFILPSLREEWGLVVNEAMASGLPVVVSVTAGCAEDLLEPCGPQDGCPPQTVPQMEQAGLMEKARTNGFVFDPPSSEELSRILLVLGASPELRRVMGQASRRIVEKFSCENFARNAMYAAQVALGTEVRN